MDITDIIAQLQKGINNRNYNHSCCNCVFGNLYEFRKHIYECHKDEYTDLEPYFHRERPKELTKKARHAKVSKALKRKRLAKKGKRVHVKADYFRQPRARIIYNHNGPKIR